MEPAKAKDAVRMMKGIPDGRGVRWPVRDDDMSIIGHMRGFDKFCLLDAKLIETMAEWHTAYRGFFLTQFVVTPENKRDWLKRSVLGNDLKMLFLMETPDGRVVGQDGFTIEEGGVFSLDGTMRWGRGAHPEFFRRDILERVAIGYYLLGSERCVAEVFSDNSLAADNLLELGFEIDDEIPLSVCCEGDVIKYFMQSDPLPVNSDKTLLCMSIAKDFFSTRYKKLIDNPCWDS
ncbi:hypothetical protein LJC31_04130 [Synergistaceae bacterium OttesenSCG-928-I11]|nr:hypothetical protein [Synergistaceae bacterium OttesenSCG-928-I11]